MGPLDDLIRRALAAFPVGFSAPQPGDLVMDPSALRNDMDAIGWLVAHGDAPYNVDGSGPVREVWDIEPLSGAHHRLGRPQRWENAEFFSLPPDLVELARRGPDVSREIKPGDMLFAVAPDGAKTEKIDASTTLGRLTALKADGWKFYSMPPPPPLSLAAIPIAPPSDRWESDLDLMRERALRAWKSPVVVKPVVYMDMGGLETPAELEARLDRIENVMKAVDLLVDIIRVCVRAASATLLELDAAPRAVADEPPPPPRPIEID